MRRFFRRDRTALAAAISALVLFAIIGALLWANASQGQSPLAASTNTPGTVQYQVTPTDTSTGTATNTGTPIPGTTVTITPSSTSTVPVPHGEPHFTPTVPTSTPGGPTPTPGQGSTPTPTATTPSAPTSTPTAAPTSAPSLFDDDIAVGPTTWQTTTYSQVANAQQFVITIQNTGTTSWEEPGARYVLQCLSAYCPSTTFAEPNLAVIAPGQQAGFTVAFTPLFPDSGGYPQTIDTTWRMENASNYGTLFGPTIHLSISENGQTQLLLQNAPGCNTPSGVSWSWHNQGGGNSSACTSSGLLMQQGSTSAPEIMVTGVPNLDPSNYMVHVHIHFGDQAGTTWAGVTYDTDNVNFGSSCLGRRIWLRSDGSWQVVDDEIYYGQTVCTKNISASGKVTASTDYDLMYLPSGGPVYFDSNKTSHVANAVSADPPFGVGIYDPSGTSSPVYFSGFEVDGPAPLVIQYRLGS